MNPKRNPLYPRLKLQVDLKNTFFRYGKEPAVAGWLFIQRNGPWESHYHRFLRYLIQTKIIKIKATICRADSTSEKITDAVIIVLPVAST